eukprot:1160967-Pelagomonas_calceolata.AAC.2
MLLVWAQGKQDKQLQQVRPAQDARTNSHAACLGARQTGQAAAAGEACAEVAAAKKKREGKDKTHQTKGRVHPGKANSTAVSVGVVNAVDCVK